MIEVHLYGKLRRFAKDSAPNSDTILRLPVEAGDTIVCDYLGQVWNGEVFDNSYDRGTPLTFQIGVGMVIKGWDDGLIGQRVGSRVLLSIPSDLGYGARGVPQAGIKGGDTLVFVTDIVGIE